MTFSEAQAILEALDRGQRRVCCPSAGEWRVDEKAKEAILTVFRECSCALGPGYSFDKIPLKVEGWSHVNFQEAGIRIAPGATIRKGAFIAPQAVVMNAFVNVGAFVGHGTMIDSFVNVGSCAQIGQNCHIASHVVLGGVLEPAQARPVIIEDECFIGAHAAVVEGVLVHRGAVLGMGVRIGASTKIIDRETGRVFQGEVPEGAVVVPGTCTVGQSTSGLAQSCAVIVRYGGSIQNTGINHTLRE